jgi:hypothetical protein
MIKMKFFKLLLAIVAITMLAVVQAGAQEFHINKEDIPAKGKEYSPFVGDHFPTRPLFGDTHLHTSWSVDAGVLGAILRQDSKTKLQEESVHQHGIFTLLRLSPTKCELYLLKNTEDYWLKGCTISQISEGKDLVT